MSIATEFFLSFLPSLTSAASASAIGEPTKTMIRCRWFLFCRCLSASARRIAWQRQVDARGDGEEAEVEQPDWAQVETVPAWDLPTKRNWMLMHDKQVVVGPIGDWVRETLQNGYSTRYLSAQTAGLYVEKGEEKEVRVGCELELDGERWEVRSVEDGEVLAVLDRLWTDELTDGEADHVALRAVPLPGTAPGQLT